MRLDRQDASRIFAACGINPADDFHRLNAGQVEALLEHADAHKYRKPANANGSRGRYFHAYLSRAHSRRD